MSESLRAMMNCAVCGRETEHEFVYLGRILAQTTCMSCGHIVRHEQRDLVPTYIRDLEHRIATKPFRMAKRVRKDKSFLRGLPRAVLRQPRKFLDDFRMLFRRFNSPQ